MLDTTISGSYLRGLKWSADAPAANDRARREQFDAMRVRSFLRETVQLRHVVVEPGLTLEEDHVFCWYLPIELAGPRKCPWER